MDLATRRTTQLTRHFSIDTEPVWMPDGRSIAFTSDRAGKPQIYLMPATGGEPQRVTFQGEYNARASVAYDGKKFAMAQGAGNVYRIAVLDRSMGGSGELRTLSPGKLDESPSFAPNGAMVILAGREGGKGILQTVSSDGQTSSKLNADAGEVREPVWGPYQK
jgi:TolB protein